MTYDLYDTFYDALFNDGRNSRNMMLRTDILEENDSYVLYIDMPGAKKEDIKLDYVDKYLKVSYKEKSAIENDTNEDKHNHYEGKYLRRERFGGSYSRSFLFNDIDANNIEASYTDGVLKVVLHKRIESGAKQIEIK